MMNPSTSSTSQHPEGNGMITNVRDAGTDFPKLKVDTRGALANINYNTLIDPEQNASSEDEALQTDSTEPLPAGYPESAIGVSISREQTRLTSPRTPAIEKAAVIEKTGGFFGGFDGSDDALVAEDDDGEAGEEIEEEEISGLPSVESAQASNLWIESTESTSPTHSPSLSEAKLPSPWRVNANADWQTHQKRRSGILEGFLNRKRASTANESTIEAWQRSFLSSLPAMPKRFSISPSSSSLPTDKPYTGAGIAESSDVTSDARSEQPAPGSTRRHDIDERVQSPSLTAVRTNTSLLRRSTSDQSLVTQRALSRVESLGDDSRFEDVHDQVNSRLKAIKDSWADANIKIPGMPAFRVSGLTTEALRERVNSINKRNSVGALPTTTSASTSSRSPKPTDPMTRQPYSNARAAISDVPADKVAPHPHFHRALSQLEGDIVVLGGYRGSILRSAEPPNRQVWVPMKVGLNLRKVNLEVGFDEKDDERSTDRIIPGGMLTHIGPVDMGRRLLKRLRGCDNANTGKLRVWEYGYDWRLTPSYLSAKLIEYLESLPCNRSGVTRQKRGAIVLAHSLGGLITRHAVNQRPDLFAGVVYAGVPQTCVNILGPLRNGDEVLLSDRVLTAQVNFSIRTSFALLPLDGRCFVDKETKEEYRVDFFDVNTWDEYRLSPCMNRALPPLTSPPKNTGITGYISSMASILPSNPLRSTKDNERSTDPSKATTANGAAAGNMTTSESSKDADRDDNPRTAVTISHDEAREYLNRTLASVKRFKQELAFNPEHADANKYPPIAAIYGKSTPTVYGARVNGREGIKHADAYDDLAFASGDGVVLARAAMVPEGYKTARGGLVASDRGHVTLLGDLEAVGKCLNAVIRARKKGVGYGSLTS